jgi:hypothetical protein
MISQKVDAKTKRSLSVSWHLETHAMQCDKEKVG